jgi:hypothetical protein
MILFYNNDFDKRWYFRSSLLGKTECLFRGLVCIEFSISALTIEMLVFLEFYTRDVYKAYKSFPIFGRTYS